MSFKLTYSTMYNPPAEMHQRFDAALATVRADLGRRHGLYIDGGDVMGESFISKYSPADTDLLLGHFSEASADDAVRAVAAARAAYPAWRALPMRERLALLRRAAALIEERVYLLSAAVALEVGKNRMEALGEVQETADFFVCYCNDFEAHNGFDKVLPDDPLEDWRSHNRSVMRPHGVWAVITPFNYPFALAGGPVAAALVTGNTVVLKGATDTPWAGRLLAECLHDAGIPAGVFNYVCGGAVVGSALVEHPHIGGVTFTGSYAVGMEIMRKLASRHYPRPCIAEMGGKNACIVTAAADLERAASGIARSAFGMGGQKCSALSRLYVHESVADELIGRLRAEIDAIRIGDPCVRENWLGPVVNERAYRRFVDCATRLAADGGRVYAGGEQLRSAALARGYYVQPTLAELPREHALWREEMFLPILTVARTRDNADAMTLANASDFGLTAGFYGSAAEVDWFHENIEAGVTYANRPQGATTGAWPGYQPFGGWKGSGSTGKAIASFYYLPLYLREQSRTVVE
ncbi:MAG: aldehyde dehydrogenase family protein [Gammaproteobacteria bacterium]|nr:aldehyde dehydrogenase family protein [Gammaproteobacteria bacterium]